MTNIWQLLSGPSFGVVTRLLWPMMAAIVAGALAGSGMLTSGKSDLTTAALGTTLTIYGAHTLLAGHFA